MAEFEARIKNIGILRLIVDHTFSAFYLSITLDARHRRFFHQPEAEGYGTWSKLGDTEHVLLRSGETVKKLTTYQRSKLKKDRFLVKSLRHAMRALVDRNADIEGMIYRWISPNELKINIKGIPFGIDSAERLERLAKQLSAFNEEFR